MRIKLQDNISCIARAIVFAFMIFVCIGWMYLVYIENNSIDLGFFVNICGLVIFLYFLIGLLYSIYLAINVKIKLLDDMVELFVFVKTKEKSNSFFSKILFGESEYREKPMRYSFSYSNLKGYGINENRIFFSLKDKTIIRIDEEKISNKDRKKLFNYLTNKTKLKPLYDSDLIVNYDDYKKYGKVVKSKMVYEDTKYEIRLKDNIYHVIIFRKIFTDNYKEYTEYKNGLDILWIEDKTGVHITDNLKSAIEIAKEYSE